MFLHMRYGIQVVRLNFLHSEISFMSYDSSSVDKCGCEPENGVNDTCTHLVEISTPSQCLTI